MKSDAIVGIFPSDHYYADNVHLRRSNRRSNVSSEHDDSIVLIGAKPEWPEVEFGWIEPGVSVTNGTLHTALRCQSIL